MFFEQFKNLMSKIPILIIKEGILITKSVTLDAYHEVKIIVVTDKGRL